MTARERAAGILGPKKLRQLEDAGLKVVDEERDHVDRGLPATVVRKIATEALQQLDQIDFERLPSSNDDRLFDAKHILKELLELK